MLKKLRTCKGKVSRLVRGLLSAVLTFSPAFSYAGPTGSAVQQGQITISSPDANTTLIQQGSQNGIINWQDFSIGAGESVNFQVPSAQAKTLNRVVGHNVSDIQGQLSSNGQLYLVNPNGVVFGAGSRVDAAGLLVTTSDISNEDFLNNFLNLQESPAGSRIVNEGQISIKDGGFALLVAPQVVNNGTIIARFGKVGLGAGAKGAIDLYGDGLIQFAPSSQAFELANNGIIEGGYVELTAADVDALLKGIVRVDGVIKADRVTIDGGDNSIVRLNGSIEAKRTDSHTGGRVDVLGDIISLLENTDIDASGELGGGQVHIGGDYQGKGSLRTASNSYISAGAEINASAVQAGDGGKVILWADNSAHFGGHIKATGGQASGDGGFVETSGKRQLSYRGVVDVTAENGNTGALLLDPQNITISSDTFTPTDIANGVFWFDADNGGGVNLSGSDITQVNDLIAGLGGSNDATQGTTANQADLVIGGLNGRDVMNFDGDDEYDISNNANINTSNHDDRLMFITFRTGADVATRQYVYEQGGGTNGYGFYVEGGQMVIGGWRNSGTAWNNYGTATVQPNTTYVAALNLDRSANSMDMWLNGAKIQTFANVSNGQNSHTGDIQLGASGNSRLNGGGDPGDCCNFTGQIGEVIQYTTAGTDAEVKEASQYFALQWGATLDAPGEDYTISLEVLESQLAAANITLQAEDNITIDDIADDSLDLAMDATGSFTLIADNDGDGTGTISMDASDAIETQGGDITMSGAVIDVNDIISNGGDVTLSATAALTADNVNAGAGNIALTADSDNNSAAVALTASDLTADGITLTGGTDNDDTLALSGTITSGAGGLSLNNFASADLNGTIDTNGQNFNNSVNMTFSGASTIQTGGGDILQSGTLDGPQSIILNAAAGNINVSGNAGAGTALSTLTATGATIQMADVTTTGDQTYTGPLTTNGDLTATAAGNIQVNSALTLGADTAITTNSGNVVLASATDGAQALTLSSASGNVTASGNIGSGTALNSLVASGANVQTLRVTTTGAQSYTGAYTINGDLTATGAGSIQTNNAVTLGADAVLTTNTGNVNLVGTVDGAQNLTLTSTTGNVAAGAAIGGGTVLTSLTASGATIQTANVTTTGNQAYTGPLTTNGDLTATGAGNVQVNNALTLGADTVVTTNAGNINLASTTDGAQNLTLNSTFGNVTASGNIGTGTALTSLTASAAAVNVQDATTTGSQTYTGPTTLNGDLTATGAGTIQTNNAVTLGADTVITTNSGNVNFISIVDGAQALNVNSTSGGLTASANIGSGTPLTSFNVGAATANLQEVTTSGAIGINANTTYNADLNAGTTLNLAGTSTLAADALFQSTGGGLITLGGSLDGAQNLTLTTAGALSQGATMGAGTRLTSLVLNTGSSSLNGDIYTTNALAFGANTSLASRVDSLDTITFNNPLMLTGAGTVVGPNGITFAGTVNGNQNLTLNSTAGDINFAGNVGDLTPLGTLTVNDTGNITFAGSANLAAYDQQAGRAITSLGTNFNTSGNIDILGMDITGDILSAADVIFDVSGEVTGQLFADSYALKANKSNQNGEVNSIGGIDALAEIDFTVFGVGDHLFNGFLLPYQRSVSLLDVGYESSQVNRAGIAVAGGFARTISDIPDLEILRSSGRSRVGRIAPTDASFAKLVQGSDNSLVVNPFLMDFRSVDIEPGTEAFYNPYPYLEKSVWNWLSYKN